MYFQELVTPDSDGLVEVAVAYDGSVEPVDDLHIRLVRGAHRGLSAGAGAVRGPSADPAGVRRRGGLDRRAARRRRAPAIRTKSIPGTGTRFDVAYPVAS